MQDQKIICPQCGEKIPLSETLTQQLKASIETELKKHFADEKEEFIKSEKIKMWKVAQEKAAERLKLELKTRDEEIAEQKKKVDDLQKQEIELRKERRDIEEKKRKMELDMERKIDEIRKETIDKLKKEVDETSRMKVLEKEKQIEQMRKTIEELKRKSEQGSMQVQGDTAETDLKILLQNNFPMDDIKDVPTGVTGADLVHQVNTLQGKHAGMILWESKNTKSFIVDWIVKLREDQVKTKADICVLVSRVLPDNLKGFGEIKGVFVVDYRSLIPLTIILRNNIISLSKMRQSIEGSSKKMEFLYKYLLSPEFRTKIENIINAFSTMKHDLEREKRALNVIWSRREKEIERVINSTTSLYGDLQGATGNTLPKIERLELPESTEQIESDSQDEMPF